MRNSILVTLLLISKVAWAALPGEQAFDAGDYETAQRELLNAPELKSSAAMKLMLSRIYLDQNALDKAEAQINEAMALSPDDAEPHALLGQLYGMKASRASLFKAGKIARQSEASFQRALALDDTSEEALLGMIRYRLNAPALFGGDIEQALALTNQLTRINAVSGTLEKASILARQKKQDEQIKLLLGLVETHPEDPRAMVALGFVHQNDRRWDEARDWFGRASSTPASLKDQVFAVQMARYQTGRTAVLSRTEDAEHLKVGVNALSTYIEGPRLAGLPALEWAHYRRGLLHERSGNASLARDDFQRAANSDDPDLLKLLKQQ